MEFLLKDCVSSQFSLILIDISKLYPSQKKTRFLHSEILIHSDQSNVLGDRGKTITNKRRK